MRFVIEVIQGIGIANIFFLAIGIYAINKLFKSISMANRVLFKQMSAIMDKQDLALDQIATINATLKHLMLLHSK